MKLLLFFLSLLSLSFTVSIPTVSKKPVSSLPTITEAPAKITPEDRLIGTSAPCSEPATKEEYLSAARRTVAVWLDSLQNETGEYKLTGYTFVSNGDNRDFLGNGILNGGREFVCYVAFETEGTSPDSVFYADGTYDTFYHYYFGPGVYARFRWEDGICTLTDYDRAYALLTSDTLKSGLYGINTEYPEYQTFFDFMNDSETVTEWLESGISQSVHIRAVSHNVMMLGNGDIIFMDVSAHPDSSATDGMVTDAMNQYFYDKTGTPRYSSPVDYKDGSGAVIMTYRDGFSLKFADYNHDGNPDYTIRIASDENGSTYDLRCMDDGGTPWCANREIYVYGEFDESILLQVSDNGSLLIPDRNSRGDYYLRQYAPVSDLSYTEHVQVSDTYNSRYRMYSQKFFLPEGLRSYGPETSEIICCFWNNTDEAVSVGGSYSIEKQNGDSWSTVASGKTFAQTEVISRKYAELTFDISDITDSATGLYRIKFMIGNEAVYGGFYLGE